MSARRNPDCNPEETGPQGANPKLEHVAVRADPHQPGRKTSPGLCLMVTSHKCSVIRRDWPGIRRYAGPVSFGWQCGRVLLRPLHAAPPNKAFVPIGEPRERRRGPGPSRSAPSQLDTSGFKRGGTGGETGAPDGNEDDVSGARDRESPLLTGT